LTWRRPYHIFSLSAVMGYLTTGWEPRYVIMTCTLSRKNLSPLTKPACYLTLTFYFVVTCTYLLPGKWR